MAPSLKTGQVEHLSSRLQFFENAVAMSEKRLRSIQKWPWKKAEKVHLISGMSWDYQKVGTLQMALGLNGEARTSFLRLASLIKVHEKLVSSFLPTIVTGRAVCSLLIVGLDVEAVDMARNGIEQLSCMEVSENGKSDEEDARAVSTRRYGLRALFKWIAGSTEAALQDAQKAVVEMSSKAWYEAYLWARCVNSGLKMDEEAFNRDLDTLVGMVDRLHSAGNPSYSEDVAVYSPGIAIAKMGIQRGMSVNPLPYSVYRIV